jgi:M6 family metalloprotease-like protein
MFHFGLSLTRLLLAIFFSNAYGHEHAPVKNLCKLPAATRDLSTGFTSPSKYAPSIGTLKAAMFFVDFDDAPSNDTVDSLYNTFWPSAAEWYSTASYGRLSLVVDVDKTGFYRMPNTTKAYNGTRDGFHMDQYITDSIKAIGLNSKFTDSDVLYIVPTRAAVGISFSPTRMQPIRLADGTMMRNVITFGQDVHLKYGFKTLNHETGHTMGLPDLYPADNTKLARGDWVGGYDIMGLINGTSPDYFAWHKWKLGWIDDNQVDCVSQKGVSRHIITPLEVADGVKAAAVKLSATKAFVVELRKTAAYNASCSIGLLGYVINTAGSNFYPNGAPIEVLDPHTTNRGCSPQRGGKLTGAALNFAMGEKLMSFPLFGIKVSVDGVKDGNYEITIHWDGKLDDSSRRPWGELGGTPGLQGEEDEEDVDYR